MRGLATVALLLLVACAGKRRESLPPPLAGAAPEPLRQEIMSELEKYYDDFSKRDWEAFASHFWPGATITTIWQPPGEGATRVVASTVDEFVAKAPEGPDSKPIFEERMMSADVRASGNLAHAWAHYTARFGDPDAVQTWRGIDAFTLMKHDGQWKIVALAFAGES